jgi:hypothetical protein
MEWNGSDRDDMKSQINPKGTMWQQQMSLPFGEARVSNSQRFETILKA